MTKMHRTLIFRQIEKKDELHQFLKLRYKNYLNSSMKNFLKINDFEIDLDIYDIHSKHFGLFLNNQPCGYLRLICPRWMIYNSHIFSIGKDFGFFNKDEHDKNTIMENDTPEFPFLQYMEVPKSIQLYFEEIKGTDIKLIEVSRLMLFEKRGLDKLRFMVECAIAYGFWVWCGYERVIINCDKNHSGFYFNYGFKEIKGSERYYINGRQKSSCILGLKFSKSQIPERLHKRLEYIAGEYKINQQISMELN